MSQVFFPATFMHFFSGASFYFPFAFSYNDTFAFLCNDILFTLNLCQKHGAV